MAGPYRARTLIGTQLAADRLPAGSTAITQSRNFFGSDFGARQLSDRIFE
jgi:hypothetical protein